MISEFAKEKVFWTRNMNIKLVQFIEKKPNIWNPKHPKYTSVKYRDQTYAEFASKYGNEFTGQAVKDRWTNIRSTFCNCSRKLKASRVKGDGSIYKVNWHLWEACSFLLKVNKNNKSTSNKDLLNNIKYKTNEDTSCSDEDKQRDKSQDTDNTSCQNIANSILNVFTNIQNDIFDINDNKYNIIGHSICKKLNKVNNYEAAQVTNKIMEILLLYHQDNPFNPNVLKHEH